VAIGKAQSALPMAIKERDDGWPLTARTLTGLIPIHAGAGLQPCLSAAMHSCSARPWCLTMGHKCKQGLAGWNYAAVTTV
jgi:hypothetical protein